VIRTSSQPVAEVEQVESGRLLPAAVIPVAGLLMTMVDNHWMVDNLLRRAVV